MRYFPSIIREQFLLSIILVVAFLTVMGVFTAYAQEGRTLEEVLVENESLRSDIDRFKADIEHRKSEITAIQPQDIPPGYIEIDQAEFDKLVEGLDAQTPEEQAPQDDQNQLAKDLISARTALLIGKAKEFDLGAEITASGFPVSRIEEVRGLASGLRDSVLIFSQYTEIADGFGAGGIATAFLIEPDLAVTNSHNIRGLDGALNAGQINLLTFQGNLIKASLVGDNADADVALLRLEKSLSLPTLKWGDSDSIKIEDPIFTIGNPGMMGSWVTHIGLIDHIDDTGDYTKIHFSAPCQKGCSGSPIFNMNGDVIGVLFGASTADQGHLPLQLHTSLRFLKRETGLGVSAQDASSLVQQFLSEEGAQ